MRSDTFRSSTDECACGRNFLLNVCFAPLKAGEDAPCVKVNTNIATSDLRVHTEYSTIR